MFSASSFVLEFKVYIQGFGNVFLWPTVFVCFLQVPQSLCSCGFWGGQKYVWHILKYVPCILKKVGHIFSEVLMEFFRYNFFFHFFHACVIPENKGAGFGHGVKPFWESATFVNQSCRNVCNISRKTWHFDVFWCALMSRKQLARQLHIYKWIPKGAKARRIQKRYVQQLKIGDWNYVSIS